jgi:glycerophosphoryl diester phosphodiesterase
MAVSGVQLVTETFVERAHEHGVAVHVWTIDEEADMEQLLDLGVDGIISDRPTRLEAVLQRRGAAWTGR